MFTISAGSKGPQCSSSYPIVPPLVNGQHTEAVILIDADELHSPFVTVTLYSPLVDTSIDCVVAPVDQAYESPLVAVRVVLIVPPAEQNVVPSDEVIVVGITSNTSL